MSTFNVSNLLLENATKIDTLGSISNNIEQSYFFEALTFVTEMNKEFNSNTKVLYKSIMESDGNVDVINESFGDFFITVKEIIDKFIAFIKSLFARFITALHALVQSDKYIAKNKDKFKNFSDKHEFKYPGYKFTISQAVPALHALEEFNDTFIKVSVTDMYDKIKNDSAIKDKTADMANNIKDMYDKLINELDGNWYDKFRARTIGKDSESVSQSDFANSLFTEFRNGDSSKYDINVTSSTIQEAYTRFNDYKKTTSDVKNSRETVEKEYKAIKKQVEEMAFKNYDKTLKIVDGTDLILSKDLVANMDLYVKAKVNQVQEMTTIHSLAFSSKLDAIKDCFGQDKSMLYKALYKIEGTLK